MRLFAKNGAIDYGDLLYDTTQRRGLAREFIGDRVRVQVRVNEDGADVLEDWLASICLIMSKAGGHSAEAFEVELREARRSIGAIDPEPVVVSGDAAIESFVEDTEQQAAQYQTSFGPRSFMETVGLPANGKDSNPKDAVGIAKAYQSTIPQPVLWEIGLAMLEGALKYGRHNYRKAGVRASVYYDAMKRHLDDWWEGEDLDPDSELSHITKLAAGAVVLRDAMMNEMWVDDRPPRPKHRDWLKQMNEHAKRLLAKYGPDVRKAPFTQIEHGDAGQ